jgi:uncharacterized tellurite resistance protein B-like protein
MEDAMSILKWLGVVPSDDGDDRAGWPDAVRELASKLDELSPEEARRLAAFALVLARAARADMEVEPEEIAEIASIVRSESGLSADRAELVAEMAAHRNQLLGAGQDYLATREYRQLSDRDQRLQLLRCLFAVTAADHSISLAEEDELRQVASELGLELADYTSIRSEFRDKREVLRGLGGEG